MYYWGVHPPYVYEAFPLVPHCPPSTPPDNWSTVDNTHRKVTGQNGSGQNGTDKMVWTKWYTDKMVLDKMVWTKWCGQNGTILYFVYTLIQLNSLYI